MPDHISRAGQWLLRSGIQRKDGGVARYYRADLGRNNPVSTEITGYAVSAFVYLHVLTGDPAYLEAGARSARFLARTAWDAAARTMPFELQPAAFAYFFDCGIVVRGLLAAWRATGEGEYLEVAAALGQAMADDFQAGGGEFHPILELPARRPAPRDPLRWSASPGCYQLKAAMAWKDLADATGDARFAEHYDRARERALVTYGGFLPGHPDPLKVMDRLHAFLYFLEGLLPGAADPRCAAAICDGIRRTAALLREIGPRFDRSDVHAQLLRIRLYADRAGVTPLDTAAAESEARELAGFQAEAADPRVEGGFYFGRKGSERLPFINPVSTAFALQALALWDMRGSAAQEQVHSLI